MMHPEKITQQEDFNKKRFEGENDNYICYLIRNNLIEEFITQLHRTNIILDSKIPQSIFETNYLLYYETSLLEYAAFFGSVQIFKFLYKNGARMGSSLWTYAVHSNNQEMLLLLEENLIMPDDDMNKTFPYKKIVIETVMCHHNDVFNYIKDKYENEIHQLKHDVEMDIISTSFRYYNFSYFPEKIEDNNIFFYFCIYGYFKLVKLFLSN